MGLTVQVGLALAVLTALTSIVSFLYKQRGAVQAPAVSFRTPVRSSLMLFRSGWYTLGIVIALSSWGFHAAALSLAPISLVQSVIAGGLVMLTVVASLIGLLVSAKSLQLGDAVPVIAVTSVAANAVTITAGPIVFGDPLPSDSIGLIARLLAFGLVISAAALTPAPAAAAAAAAE